MIVVRISSFSDSRMYDVECPACTRNNSLAIGKAQLLKGKQIGCKQCKSVFLVQYTPGKIQEVQP